MSTSFVRWLSGMATALLFVSVAFAQAVPGGTPPVRYNIDERGVDVVTGRYDPAVTMMTIGQPGTGLSYVYQPSSFVQNYVGTIKSIIIPGSPNVRAFRVTINNSATTFRLGGVVDNGQDFPAPLTDDGGTGATLDRSAGFRTVYIFTASDGTTARFDNSMIAEDSTDAPIAPPSGPSATDYVAYLRNVTTPTGLITRITHTKETAATIGSIKYYYARVEQVTVNTSYRLFYTYRSNSTSNMNDWFGIASARLINTAVENCTTSCTQTWPTITFAVNTSGGTTTTTLTDSLGRQTVYALSNTSAVLTSPGGVTVTATINATTFRVSSINYGSPGTQTFTYAYSDSGDTRTTTITGPANYKWTYTSSISTFLIASAKDALNRTTSYTYYSTGRLQRIVPPEGSTTLFVYDSRGNTTSVTRETPGPAPEIVTSATYSTSCSNPIVCNRPLTTTDPLGNVTNYAYETNDDGVVTRIIVTAPPPITGVNKRPETRYRYNSVGGLFLLTEISTCSESDNGDPDSCVGTAKEALTTIAYQPTGNRLPISTTSSAGDGSISPAITWTYGYDAIGNVVTVDGPNTGPTDTTRFIFDLGRRQRGIIGPQPDASGPTINRAIRVTYNNDNSPTLTERGTTVGQTDTAWNNFAPLEKQETTYDSLGRPIKGSLAGLTPPSTWTTYAVVQYGYDGVGRLECVAQRMNAAQFGSLPSSACTQGTGNPDRIAKTIYDAAGQPLQQLAILSSSSQLVQSTSTYTDNGQLETVKDAKNNLTTYAYDIFGRLRFLYYPSPTTPNTSSTSDYEQYAYDLASRIDWKRVRGSATQTIDFTYDNLGRLTAQDLPVATTYTYDLQGRMLTASANSQTLQWVYNALGQVTRRTDAFGNWTFSYDPYGRRRRMDWPGADNFYVVYDYDRTGAMTRVRQNGADSGADVLAVYSYDNLGNRTAITRGNGTSTTYGYDPASRLTALTQDLSGTGNDFAKAFTYNPAGQILSQTLANDSYIFQGGTLTGSYTLNGLNQITQALGNTVTHDAKGNLTGEGTRTYEYDQGNRLTCYRNGSGACTGGTHASISYDPLSRLFELTDAGGTKSRFAYDGGEIVAEYNGANVLRRRWVRGASADEPIAQSEGTGFAPANRRYLHADERGSIVAMSDATGSIIGDPLTYDAYGRPGPDNTGRFQYTGQAYFAELGGLYYYKARFYNWRLMRFMQTDPIGYAAGLNLYAYVGGDPINRTDPLGLVDEVVEIVRPRRKPPEIERLENVANDAPVPRPKPPDLPCRLGSSGVSALISGTNVTITGSIDFVGPGGADYLKSINQTWTNTFGPYDVTTNLTPGKGGITAVAWIPMSGVPAFPGIKISPYAEVGGKNMALFYPKGLTPTLLRYALWTAAHEFGHILGLHDGATGNDIMAADTMTPTEATIAAILANCH